MSRLVIFIIFMFFITSAVFADIDFNENIYAKQEKPVTKISDLGVTVATNEKDFRLVLKPTEPVKSRSEVKAAVKAKWFPKPEPVAKLTRKSKIKSKKSSVKAEKKNPLTRRIASSGKRVKKNNN